MVFGSKRGVNASSPSGDLEALAAEARREVASAEARLSAILERVQLICSLAAKDQADLHRFLEEFGIDLNGSMDGAAPNQQGTGPLFDLDAVRSGAHELDADVARAGGLEGNLTAIVGALRTFTEQLSPDQWFRSAQDSPDLRYQQAMNAAREDERRRLAREIHDGPAQVVANAVMHIQTVEQIAKRFPDQVADELAQLREYLRDGQAEIRRFMFDLRPAMLQDLGLGPTLRRFIDDHSRFYARRILLDIQEPLPAMTADQELAIFRIVQECLQNVHKHAGPSAEARVSVVHSDNVLVLTVADNGRGFDPRAVVPRPGHGGLTGIRERADLIGAELSVTGQPASGTVVTLKMPLRGQTGPLRSSAA